MDEFKEYVLSLYDDYLQRTENRNASYGEIAYIDSLNKKELNALLAEIEGEA